ncbi:hypothetical protein HGM15179_002476 [Zosterops borbonicus]|uniref:Uncharacterized protein n=1 Tax=Zosterops borbonicus TaxID=364589 RepID=A0A8K1LT22_9PASS|nr:hypothetical protein HGM15179_002476 [Zosterops borbonicus]
MHLQTMQDCSMEQVDAKGVCDLMENPCWSRLLAGPVASWRGDTMVEQVCCQDMRPPQATQAGAVPEALQPVKGTCSGLFVKYCSLWERFILEKFVEGPCAGVGTECEESSP